MPSEPQDRREAPREPAHLVVTIELDGKEIGCGVSRDASGTGFLLFTHLDLAPGALVSFKLFVPHEEEPRALDASVIRSERIPPNEGIVWDYRVAVALRNPPADLQELVQKFTRRPPPLNPS
jgi:PilZ domain-containing protein